jgi:hypothetical protein
MKTSKVNALAVFLVLGILLASCGILPGAVAETSEISPGSSGSGETGADTIQIISVNPPQASGISIADPINVFIHYNLTIPEGTLQIWFERFSDANCTMTEQDSLGGTTIGGLLQPISNAMHDVSLEVTPLPLMDVSYVGVGARIWTPGSSSILVEDMSYTVCYAVHSPPALLSVTSSETTPLSGATGERGSINGIVYSDLNNNGAMDSGEYGGGTYALSLSDTACSTNLANTTSDANGNFGFLDLPPGTYCVVIGYSSGLVSPGYFQRVNVVARSSTRADFGIQMASIGTPPEPPPSGYCGDGAVDSSLGEQCDPPNLTDCTASCQSYVAVCGDGYTDSSAGEQCDPPNTTDCTASCQTYVAWCGNGFVDAGETCDPPNITDCTASCQIYVPACGNFYVDFGEQCDPPNVDFCTAQCELYVPNCGNGMIELGEECDPPNVTDCTAQCQIWP